jgi:hypothetical protein
VSLSRPTATGKERVATTQDYSSEGITLMREIIYGLLKPTGNVGQQAKDSAPPYCSQAHKMTFALN